MSDNDLDLTGFLRSLAEMIEGKAQGDYLAPVYHEAALRMVTGFLRLKYPETHPPPPVPKPPARQGLLNPVRRPVVCKRDG